MQSNFYVGLSGQMTVERRLTTIAQNIANMNTAGYKAEGVTFDTLLSQTGETPVAFSGEGASFIDRSGGERTKTDNPLDVAVQGDAWFGVKTPQGVVYTHDGRMKMSPTGQLLSVNDNPILDAGGTGLILDPAAGPPTIAADGMITQNGAQVGAIGLFAIDPAAKLTRGPDSGIIPDRAATPILDFTSTGVVQGFVENSNVNPVLEITKLISVQHSLDGVTQANQTADTTLQDAIKALGELVVNRLARLGAAVRGTMAAEPLVRCSGTVATVSPTAYRVSGLSPFVRLGDAVALPGGGGDELGEVVRVERTGVTVKPFGVGVDARLGLKVRRVGPLRFAPDPSWRGRVIDALCRPVDGLGELPTGRIPVAADAEPPPALKRARVRGALKTGVKAIDIFCPICPGQRIGIFAGSGVGKSTLLAMLADARGFDSVVIALVGERGREVREFIEESLGSNRARAVTVVATGDESPMMRRLAPKTAMSIAEWFRDRGDAVLLIVDSATRYAHAARDVALAAGEPAVARGYAPSVFSDLPKLLERAGPGLEGSGSITGIFSVLVDGDDHNDPVADTIRGTLDGHIVLDRRIAAQGRYPAIDLGVSLSRLAHQVWTPEQRVLVGKLRELIGRFEETRDLRAMGAYRPGSDPDLDQAVLMVPRIYDALIQSPGVKPSEDAFRDLATALQKPK